MGRKQIFAWSTLIVLLAAVVQAVSPVQTEANPPARRTAVVPSNKAPSVKAIGKVGPAVPLNKVRLIEKNVLDHGKNQEGNTVVCTKGVDNRVAVDNVVYKCGNILELLELLNPAPLNRQLPGMKSLPSIQRVKE